MPRKLRQLISDLELSGFVNKGGKGSHRKFVHPCCTVVVVLSGKKGDDALPYQEKAIKRAIKEIRYGKSEFQ